MTLLGVAFVAYLLHRVYWADAVHWRYLAQSYGRRWASADNAFQGHLIIYGKYPLSRGYNGIARFAVHPDGVSVKVVMPPQSLYCEPLCLPFSELKGWKQTWYINDESVELELRNAPDVKLVMPLSQIEKIQSIAGQTMHVSREMSPNQAKPVIWWAFLIALPVYVFSHMGILAAIKWYGG